jgi:hypothetical protein
MMPIFKIKWAKLSPITPIHNPKSIVDLLSFPLRHRCLKKIKAPLRVMLKCPQNKSIKMFILKAEMTIRE